MAATENSSGDRRFAEAKDKIVKWLMADNWKILDSPTNQLAWRVVAEDNQQKKVAFFQLNSQPELLIIHGSIAWSDDVRARIQKLRREERDNLVWDIRFQLLNMRVKFAGVDDNFTRTAIEAKLYLDDLRRNEFVEMVSRVQDAILAAIWMVNRKFGQPALPEENGGHEFLM